MARNARVPDRYQKFIDGELSVEDLDEEELTRGQIRDKNGGFQGQPPHAIPRAFHQALVKELIERHNGKLRTMVNTATDVLFEVASNKRAPAVARNQAAIYLMERAFGKIPDRVVQEVTMKKFEADLEDIVESD